jgi:hypothetical protein
MNPNTPESDVTLCPADGEALDALVSAGCRCGSIDGDLRLRAERILQHLRLLEHYPVDPDVSTLIVHTLDRIDEYERRRRMRLTPIEARRPEPLTAGVSWRDTLATAASVLLIVAVGWPMLAASREKAMQQACRANLAGVALGFTSYANTYSDALPQRYVTAPEDNWLLSRANAANLFQLAAGGFVAFDTLNCPDNPSALSASRLAGLTNWPSATATSFSYQNLFTDFRPRWGQTARMIILGDKNPVVEGTHRGERVPGDSLSPFHRGGHNVLFTDGSFAWLTTAFYDDDNIWLPEDMQVHAPKFTGHECPTCPKDVMLTH